MAEAAVDGALDGSFVAGEFGESVGADAIGDEGAGQEVAFVGRCGRRRDRVAVLFGLLFFVGIAFLAVLVLVGDIVEAVAEDAGFHGEDAVETPLIGGDAEDQFFFAFADRVEGIEEVLDEGEEVFGVFAGEDVLVGA